jgi:hypothetical protein
MTSSCDLHPYLHFFLSTQNNYANYYTLADMELRFVKVSRSDGTRHHGTLRLFKDDCGRVRTQVILDTNRRERQQPAGEPPDWESRQLTLCPSAVGHTVNSPDLWRSSFIEAMATAIFPKEIGYAGLLEDNIIYIRSKQPWASVNAIHDAIALLHVGSTSCNDTILLEGKKRYVIAIRHLRQALNRERIQASVDAVLVVAMGLMLSEVLPQVS